jgi:hypothetical protein
MGKVIMLDPPGTAGGWLGAARPFGLSSLPIVTIEWDQYRTGVTDNLWVADTTSFDGWWAMQWDQNSQASSYFFDFGVLITVGIWQHMIYTIDTIGGTAMVEVVGVGSFSSTQPDASIGGIVFELEPTEYGGPDGPTCIDTLVITQVAQTPEPGTILLFGCGLLGLWGARRKLKK